MHTNGTNGTGSGADTQLLADIACEQAVLGAALTRPTVIGWLRDTIGPDTFVRPAHDELWERLDVAHQAGNPVTAETAWARLSSTTGHPTIPGVTAPYLIDLIQAAPVDPTVHTQRLGDLTRLRRIHSQAARIAGRATAVDADPDELAVTMNAFLEETVLEHTASLHGTNSSWTPVDLEAALAGDELDPPPTILPRSDGPCLIYPGAVHTISGEPASGKTWIALQATVIELAAGNHVMYVDFEDRATRVVGRLLQLGAKPDEIRSQFHYIRPHEALDDAGRAALTTTAAGSTLAVLDGVTEAMTLHGLDLSANPDIAQFYALLPRWIADLGPAAVLIDHVIKDDDKRGKWSIGGQHKLAGLDGAAYQVKSIEPFGRAKRGTAVITVAKDRPGYVEEHAAGRTVGNFTLDATDPNITIATLDPPRTVPAEDAGFFEPTRIMEKVSRYVEANPHASKNMIENAVTGKGTIIRLALDILTNREYLLAQSGARGATTYTSAIPYRESGDPE